MDMMEQEPMLGVKSMDSEYEPGLALLLKASRSRFHLSNSPFRACAIANSMSITFHCPSAVKAALCCSPASPFPLTFAFYYLPILVV